MSKAKNIAGISDSVMGSRNKIINGKMDISQRGVSFPAVASGAYTLDRWLMSYVSSAVGTIAQQADAPSSGEFLNSLRYTVTTADASIAAGDVALLSQYVEGYNARDLVGRPLVISFWVRSSKTGVHCIALSNAGAGNPDRSYVDTYTVNAADTWERKSITVPAGLITAGTWNWTTGRGLQLSFALACGSTFQTTAGSWQTGNFIGTAAQVNCLDTIGNIFAITGVQLETGSVATPFEHRSVCDETRRAHRYYQMMGNTVNNEFNVYGYITSGTPLLAVFSLLAEMRTTPIVTKAGSWSVTNTTGQPLALTPSKHRFTLSATANAAGMVQFNNSTASSMYVTADAEL